MDESFDMGGAKFYNCNISQLANPLIKVIETTQRGRVVVSTQQLKPGDILLQESSIAHVLYVESRRSFCSFCTNHISSCCCVECPKCHKIWYCSEDCRQKDEQMHFFECRAFLSNESDFLSDSDNLHLLRFLSIFYFDQCLEKKKDHVLYPEMKPFHNLSFIQRIFDLVGHKGSSASFISQHGESTMSVLAYASTDEKLKMLKNIVKYGIHKDLCPICGEIKGNKRESSQHFCLNEPQKWRTTVSSTQDTELELKELYENWLEDEDDKDEDDEEEEEEEGYDCENNKSNEKGDELTNKENISLNETPKNIQRPSSIQLPPCVQSDISSFTYPDSFISFVLLQALIKVRSICNCNAHSILRETGFGLFHVASLFNHSCSPNAAFSHDSKGTLRIICLKDILKGEEVCIDYSETRISRERRRKELRENYGFVCGCERCTKSSAIEKGGGRRCRDDGLLLRRVWGMEEQKILRDTYEKRKIEKNSKSENESDKLKQEDDYDVFALDAAETINNAKLSQISQIVNSLSSCILNSMPDGTEIEEISSDCVKNYAKLKEKGKNSDIDSIFGKLDEKGTFFGSWGYLLPETKEDIENEYWIRGEFSKDSILKKEQANCSIECDKQQRMLMADCAISPDTSFPFSSISQSFNQDFEQAKSNEEDCMYQFPHQKEESSTAFKIGNRTSDLSGCDNCSSVLMRRLFCLLASPCCWDDVLCAIICPSCGSTMREINCEDVMEENKKRKEKMEKGEKTTDQEGESTETTYLYLDQILNKLNELIVDTEISDTDCESLQFKNSQRELKQLLSFVISKGNEILKESTGNEQKLLQTKEGWFDWTDFPRLLLCRSHPLSHGSIVGKSYLQLSELIEKAMDAAIDKEMEANYGKAWMPITELIGGLEMMDSLLNVFGKLLHPQHELMMQCLWSAFAFVQHLFTSHHIWDIVNEGWEDDELVEEKKAEPTICQKEAGEKPEINVNSTSKQEQANKSSSSITTEQSHRPSRIKTEAMLYLPSITCAAPVSFTPESLLTLLEHPLLSSNVLCALASSVASLLLLHHPPYYPKRVLDLKICGLILLLAESSENRKESEEKEISQHETDKCQFHSSQPESSLRIFEDEVIFPQDGKRLLKLAEKEGVQCFGAEHWEVKEIQLWLDDEWREKHCWTYQKREKLKRWVCNVIEKKGRNADELEKKKSYSVSDGDLAGRGIVKYYKKLEFVIKQHIQMIKRLQQNAS